MENIIKHPINQNSGEIVLGKSKLEIYFVEGGFSTNREERYIYMCVECRDDPVTRKSRLPPYLLLSACLSRVVAPRAPSHRALQNWAAQ
jgi:hypothetical protein